MPKVEALLCDIDGTLVQSNWLHAESWQRSFREMGIELELDAVRRQIGKGGDELIPVFVRKFLESDGDLGRQLETAAELFGLVLFKAVHAEARRGDENG